MKKSIFTKFFSMVLLVAMMLPLLPVESFSSTAMILSVSNLNELIGESSPGLAEVISFADGQATGYGSNGKFLAPIEAPDPEAIPIFTAQDLDNVRDNLSGSYVLMNDIDLLDFNGGQWLPIGDDSKGEGNDWGTYINIFSGTFDGQGYIIRNLTMTAGTYSYSGLFGFIEDATIKNVGLEDTNIDVHVINSRDCVAGGIFAETPTYCFNIISNCYHNGSISATNATAYTTSYSYAGGICGISYKTQILDC